MHRSLLPLLVLLLTAPLHAQLDKGHQLLINYGLQTQGLVRTGDVFHLGTYQAGNYSTVNFEWNSDASLLASNPNFPWARWVYDLSQMPTASEKAAMPKLVMLQLGDEQNLNDTTIRQNSIDWFNSVRAQYPNTILSVNNWGSQITAAELEDFINRGKPDLISFDTYPFQNLYPSTTTPIVPPGGSPTNWYTDLRKYHTFAKRHGIPFGAYMHTFHAVQDYDAKSFRDPSLSEMNLNASSALAFGATMLHDFTYNTGASSLFDRTPQGIAAGDTYPNARFAQKATINQRARNLGKTMVMLKPLADSNLTNGQPTNDGRTTSIAFFSGKHMENSTAVYNALPSDFYVDSVATHDATYANRGAYSDFEVGRNDSYLTGGSAFVSGTQNLGTKNNGLPGDVIVSWFKLLDESFDGSAWSDQIYFTITNGLSDVTGDGFDCRQTITFDFSVGASGITSLERLNPDTGLIDDVALSAVSGKRRLTWTMDGGTTDVFKYKTGAPFVVVPEPTAGCAIGACAVLLLRRRGRGDA